jgi:hypothetical protein
MNLALLLPLLIATALGISGWFVVHWLNTNRDNYNKKRDLRLSFLLEAYRRLENGVSRGRLYGNDLAFGFESAVADIQLLGTQSQILLVKNMITQIAQRDPNPSTGPLLLSLRDELREHLGLKVIGEAPLHFRLTGEMPQSRDKA